MSGILFTKKLDKEQISFLQERLVFDQREIVSVCFQKVEAFFLENKSLIFTSIKGVESFFKNDFQIEPSQRIYCVGFKSRDFFCDQGFSVFRTEQNAENLSRFILQNCQRESFLHFCGNLSLPILDKKIPEKDLEYERIICYKTELLFPQVEKKYNAVVFFSPSGVRSFAKNNIFENFKIFSIGQSTSSELKKVTQNKIYTSRKNTFDDLLTLIFRTI